MRWSRRQHSVRDGNAHLSGFGADMRTCHLQQNAPGVLSQNSILPEPVRRHGKVAYGRGLYGALKVRRKAGILRSEELRLRATQASKASRGIRFHGT